jgi:hypothetical protein
VSAVYAATPAINSPANGANLVPGQPFDFSYDSIADYGVSSYNATVWLFTSPPNSSAPSINFADGHYFGRFGWPNYPGNCSDHQSWYRRLHDIQSLGNPSPSNPAPPQLVAPDFSVNPGGFGAGESASNVAVYFAVLEEYAT